MNKRTSITIVAVIGVALAVLVGWQLLVSRPKATATATAAAGATGVQQPGRAAQAMPTAAQAGPDDLSNDLASATLGDADLIAHLRSRYGAQIEDPYVQIKMLEKLMRYFQARDPEHWQEALLAAVRAAFPEHYEAIAANLRRRLDYEKWLDENHAALQELDSSARRERMWEQRKQLFGEDAERIWAGEFKNQAISDALAAIDVQDGTSVSDKLNMYKESLQDIHEERFEQYLEQHRQEVMDRFLDLQSIQSALATMEPAERARSLREIRKDMGLDEAALARWDALDRERDDRWAKGLEYMKERAALAQKYQGDELEARLVELRTRYFGSEAELIGQEERSGFFRYDRPRRWGRN